jgi:2,3-dihydroxybenzoate-AMP ligase
MFDQLVRYSARFTPLAIAVSNGSEHVSYRELDGAIDRIAAALAGQGVDSSARVGIAVRDTYRHLLLVLGCARLGTATVSLAGHMARPMAALAGATLLIADEAALEPAVLADAGWFAQANAGTATPPSVTIDPQALGRVQLSSGSTGEPKAVGMSWALLDRRIEHNWTRHFGYERMLSLVGPESGSLPLFLWVWARGGCVLIGSPDPHVLARSLPLLQPTGLLAAPSQLAVLLDALPPEATPLPGLQVAVASARAAMSLRDRVALRLGTVNVTYASTEAGVVANAFAASLPRAEAAGWVTPWSEVEIVDDTNVPLPHGTSGRIRLRGVDVVSAYLGGAGDDRFRDGWFYPGDIGSLGADGMLFVDGREDEVMNLGGEKYLPHMLEEPVRSVSGVADVAAFALADAHGVEQPWLAVVRDGEIAEDGIARALGHLRLPQVRIAWIDALPRTPLGKVRREALREGARRLSDGRDAGI